jgi:hypothetical protein
MIFSLILPPFNTVDSSISQLFPGFWTLNLALSVLIHQAKHISNLPLQIPQEGREISIIMGYQYQRSLQNVFLLIPTPELLSVEALFELDYHIEIASLFVYPTPIFALI